MSERNISGSGEKNIRTNVENTQTGIGLTVELNKRTNKKESVTNDTE